MVFLVISLGVTTQCVVTVFVRVVGDVVVVSVFLVIFLDVNAHCVKVSVFVCVVDDSVDVKVSMMVFLGVNSHSV